MDTFVSRRERLHDGERVASARRNFGHKYRRNADLSGMRETLPSGGPICKEIKKTYLDNCFSLFYYYCTSIMNKGASMRHFNGIICMYPIALHLKIFPSV